MNEGNRNNNNKENPTYKNSHTLDKGNSQCHVINRQLGAKAFAFAFALSEKIKTKLKKAVATAALSMRRKQKC